MEPFDKLNETFNIDNTPSKQIWPILKFILLLIWTFAGIYWLNDGISYISENGLKPAIIRLWEGPK